MAQLYHQQTGHVTDVYAVSIVYCRDMLPVQVTDQVTDQITHMLSLHLLLGKMPKLISEDFGRSARAALHKTCHVTRAISATLTVPGQTCQRIRQQFVVDDQ